MCEWGDTSYVLVPVDPRLAHDGKFKWESRKIDSCIADLVHLLNLRGFLTANSCCGHGRGPVTIVFHGGFTITGAIGSTREKEL